MEALKAYYNMFNITEKRDYKYIEQTFNIAKDVEKFGNSRHAAIIVYKNNIIAYGTNYNPKTHPFSLRFGKNEWAIHLHAETEAIKNAQNKGFEYFNKATLYVARAKYSKSEIAIKALSMPCEGCMECIKYFDISRVVFTLDNNRIGVLAIS